MHAEPARQARPIMKMSQRLMLVVLFTGLASACSPSPDAARVAGQAFDRLLQTRKPAPLRKARSARAPGRKT